MEKVEVSLILLMKKWRDSRHLPEDSPVLGKVEALYVALISCAGSADKDDRSRQLTTPGEMLIPVLPLQFFDIKCTDTYIPLA